MFNIEASPPLVSLAESPFVWRVFSDHADSLLKIMAEPVSDFFELLPPDPALHTATFELSEYYRNYLSVSLQLNEPTIHAEACKAFYVKFYQYYGNPPETHDMTGISRWVLIGKIPKWKQTAFYNQFNNFFAWLSTCSLLSFYPDQVKNVLPSQPEVIYFIAPTSATYALVVTMMFDDETSLVYRPNSIELTQYQVGSFPVGYTQLNLAAQSEKKIVQYTIEVENAIGSRVYKLDYSDYRDIRYLVFRNSLGGYDTLACTGEADESTDVERLTTENVFDANKPGRLNKSVRRVEETEIVKVNTGWLQANEKDWLNELVISTEVFEIRGAIKCPVVMKTTSLDRSQRIFEPGSVELEYERLYVMQ